MLKSNRVQPAIEIADVIPETPNTLIADLEWLRATEIRRLPPHVWVLQYGGTSVNTLRRRGDCKSNMDAVYRKFICNVVYLSWFIRDSNEFQRLPPHFRGPPTR